MYTIGAVVTLLCDFPTEEGGDDDDDDDDANGDDGLMVTTRVAPGIALPCTVYFVRTSRSFKMSASARGGFEKRDILLSKERERERERADLFDSSAWKWKVKTDSMQFDSEE